MPLNCHEFLENWFTSVAKRYPDCELTRDNFNSDALAIYARITENSLEDMNAWLDNKLTLASIERHYQTSLHQPIDIQVSPPRPPTSTSLHRVTQQPPAPPKHQSKRFKAHQTAKLVTWLANNIDVPFISSEDRATLMHQTGLREVQLLQWASNMRRRHIPAIQQEIAEGNQPENVEAVIHAHFRKFSL